MTLLSMNRKMAVVFYSIALLSLPALRPAFSASIDSEVARVTQSYVVDATNKIKSRWQAETDNLRKIGHISKSPYVQITIMPDGKITKIFISQPSGNNAVDELAKEVVEKSSPLPPLPPELKKSNEPVRMELELVVAYIPKGGKEEVARTEDLTERARALIKDGEIDKATKFLEEQIALPGQLPGVLVHLKAQLSSIYANQAEVIMQKEPHSPKALEAAKRAQELNPGDSSVNDMVKKLSGK